MLYNLVETQKSQKVSLISSLAKVFESVLENRFVLYNLVETQKSRKKPLYVCYIDLTKGFAFLNRDALIVKLQQRNVDGKFLNTINLCFINLAVELNGMERLASLLTDMVLCRVVY